MTDACPPLRAWVENDLPDECCERLALMNVVQGVLIRNNSGYFSDEFYYLANSE